MEQPSELMEQPGLMGTALGADETARADGTALVADGTARADGGLGLRPK